MIEAGSVVIFAVVVVVVVVVVVAAEIESIAELLYLISVYVVERVTWIFVCMYVY